MLEESNQIRKISNALQLESYFVDRLFCTILKMKEREKGKKKIDRKRERMEREKTLSVKNKERYGENANSTSPERLKCYAYTQKQICRAREYVLRQELEEPALVPPLVHATRLQDPRGKVSSFSAGPYRNLTFLLVDLRVDKHLTIDKLFFYSSNHR